MRIGLLAGVVLLTLLGGSRPAEAMRPCRPRPLVAAIWPGTGGENVPVDAVLYLSAGPARKSLLELWLLDVESGAKVPVEQSAAVDPTVIMLRPQAPLVAERAYEVWARVSVTGRSHFGKPVPELPGAWDMIVLRFSPTDRRAGGKAPRMKRPRVKFKEWRPADGNMARLRYEGREADLVFARAKKAPALVLLRGVYRREGGVETEWSAALPYGRRLNISSTGGMPCAGRSRPPAPQAGRYELTLTPWSASGVAGAPVKVKGAIE